jgi:sortase (surface protein transpeptidase)
MGNAVWWALLAVAVVAASAVVAVVLLRPRFGQSGQGGLPFGPASAHSQASAPSVPAAPQGDQRPTSDGVLPIRLRIDSIGVSTELISLGIDSSGALEVPVDPNVAGWFNGGPTPGEVGPALLAGHVDSKKGPGVFFQLKTLQTGAEILVDRSDGKTVAFRVQSVRAYPKDQFPTAAVYAPTPVPELRLVTCGGPFDRLGGRYLDNVIVSAVLV